MTASRTRALVVGPSVLLTLSVPLDAAEHGLERTLVPADAKPPRQAAGHAAQPHDETGAADATVTKPYLRRRKATQPACVGDVIPEVRLQLVDAHGNVYYKAVLEQVEVRGVFRTYAEAAAAPIVPARVPAPAPELAASLH